MPGNFVGPIWKDKQRDEPAVWRFHNLAFSQVEPGMFKMFLWVDLPVTVITGLLYGYTQITYVY